jgi:hypothetical protein
MYVLFNILDIAAINSWILYKETTLEAISRRQFTMKLVEELIHKEKPPLPTRVQTPKKRRRCQISECENKTQNRCCSCEKFLCGVHGEKRIVLHCTNCPI